MYYVEAPYNPPTFPLPTVFMAGGITGCRDWQFELAKLLAPVKEGTLLNPRRTNWPKDDPLEGERQIKWEASFLWHSKIIPFWFCKDALCPITLFELGTQIVRSRMTPNPANPSVPKVKLCVGVELGYAREFDVRTQISLLAPNIPICSSLDDLAAFVAKEVEEQAND